MSGATLDTERRHRRPATRGTTRMACDNPWRKPRFLQAITWGYLFWSMLPVVIAVIFSFNAGRSRSAWQGFSLRWWYQDPTDSLLARPGAPRGDDPDASARRSCTVLIAVPLGTLFAIGIDRWHGRPAARRELHRCCFSFVVPEIILGVSLFLLFTNLLKSLVPARDHGAAARAGDVPVCVPVHHRPGPITLDRARVRGSGDGPGRHPEPGDPARAPARCSHPAIFASVALVFADTVDDFVTVRYLSGPAPTASRCP